MSKDTPEARAVHRFPSEPEGPSRELGHRRAGYAYAIREEVEPLERRVSELEAENARLRAEAQPPDVARLVEAGDALCDRAERVRIAFNGITGQIDQATIEGREMRRAVSAIGVRAELWIAAKSTTPCQTTQCKYPRCLCSNH
jgi:hypothetical protein